MPLLSSAWIRRTLALLLLACPCPLRAAPLSDEPNRVLYQIYLSSFQDSGAINGKADGTGDFAGAETRLDYLQDLGVTGILLMPVFNDTGGMGYRVNDFEDIRRDYGGSSDLAKREAAFKQLISAAHARGIKVLLDLPINHIADSSAWFQKSRAREPGFENFFNWEDQPLPGWRIPWDAKSGPESVWHLDSKRKQYYYGLFGGGMPDLNHREPAVQAKVLGILKLFSSFGIDGFRIDAAKHFVEGKDNLNPLEPENLALMRKYLAQLRTDYPNASFLLEAWSGNPLDYEPYLPDAGDIVFDFAYLEALRDSSSHDHPYSVRKLIAHQESVQSQYKPGARIVFAGNHDVARLRTLLGDDQGRTEVAQAATLLLPFTPMLYYGDEIFMPGEYVHSTDPKLNHNGACTPMAWSPAQNAGFTDSTFPPGKGWDKKIHPDWKTYNVQSETADPASFLNFVRETLLARRALGITGKARVYVKSDDPSDSVLQFALKLESGACAVGLFNFTQTKQTARPIAFPGICESSVGFESLVARRADSGALSTGLGRYGFYFGRAK